MIVGGAQENTLASVHRVAPDRFESSLWTGPQAGPEGSLLDEARRLGHEPALFPDLVREIAPVRDLRVVGRLTREMRRRRIQIVHTHSSKAGIVGRVAARRAGVPIVVHTAHGWGFHDHMSSARRGLYVSLERAMAHRCHVIVSVSERGTREGLDAGIGRPDQYRLIRSGIPLDRFGPDAAARERMRRQLNVGPEDLVVGSVGRISPQKNPEDFLRLASRCDAGGRKIHWLYVGDGSLRAEVEAETRAAGLQDRVRWLGLRRDIPDLLRAMDLFVLTSRWEGLPRVVPQALFTGIPVACYSVAGIREIVRPGENGVLAPPDDLDTLVREVQDLLADDARRAALSRVAFEEFDPSFSEDRMIADLEELYEELVSRYLKQASGQEQAAASS